MSSDMLICGKLGKGTLELLLGEIQSVVVNALAGVLESLQKQIHFSKVSLGPKVSITTPPTTKQRCHWTHPLPSSITIDPEGMLPAISLADDSST